MPEGVRSALALLWLLCLVATGSARAGEPPTQPFLRIEAAGHTSAVPRLAIDATGRLLATAGYDKTIRLWSLPDGAPVAVLRPPIGALQEGEINAVAVSPDGRRVFAAGATAGQWDNAFAIYIFDTERATLVNLLGGLPAPVNDLTIAPDGAQGGARFAAGLAQGGIRVWSSATGALAFEDKAYTGPVRSVVLDREGRLFTAAADGRVRVYDAAGKKLADAAAPSGSRPWGLAVSPDGALLAVSQETADKTGRMRVDVISARTLAPVFTPDTTGLTGDGLLTVAWAADARGGVQLLAGGYAHDANFYVIRRWGDFGLGGYTDLAAARDTIRHIVPLPGGGAVYATEDPGWGRIAPDGRIVRLPTPVLADLRPSREKRLALSLDGDVVEFATAAGVQRFAARDRSLTSVTANDAGLIAARTDSPELRLVGWRDSNAPTLNGRRLALERDEIARAVAILPDGSGVLLGTDTHLRVYDKDGKSRWVVDTPAAVRAVVVAGRVAVATLLDGSVRWFGLDDGIKERAALVAHADGVRWVLFTPDGFFDHADRGGNELVGVHLNGTRKQQPEWISFSQAYRVLYAPTLVRARLLGQPPPPGTRQTDLGDIRSRLARQPTVEIKDACLPQADLSCRPLALKPNTPIVVPADAASIRLGVVVTERGLGVGSLDLFVNDRNAGRIPAPANGRALIVDAALDQGSNAVQARIYDKSGAIFTQAAPLLLTRAGPATTTGRGRLFALVIGVDQFTAPSLTLKYAVADARAFAQGIRQGAASVYGSVDITVLLDKQATRAGILSAFDLLARQIRPNDTFLFYIATHGVRDEAADRFLLIPQDVSNVSSLPALARQSIDEATLVAALSRIEARDALLFLDTCHAAQLTTDTLANVGHETGRYLLAASSSVQEALDSYDNRNGVFLFAVREALEGRAGRDVDGNLGALGLGEYVSRRVSELARQKGHDQDAVFRAAQRDLRSFPIVKVAP